MSIVMFMLFRFCFFFSSRRRHTRFDCDWSSDVCSSDLFVVEGRILVRRLLESGRFRVRSLLVTERALEGLRDLLDSRAGGLPILLATEAIVRGIVGYTFHRGCLAVGERGIEPAAGPRTLPTPTTW